MINLSEVFKHPKVYNNTQQKSIHIINNHGLFHETMIQFIKASTVSSKSKVNLFHAKRATQHTGVDLRVLALFFVILGAFFPQRTSAFTLPNGWNSTSPTFIIQGVVTGGGDSAITPTGITFVWTEFGNDGDQQGVFARHFSPGLLPLVPKFQVNTYFQGKQWFPSIVSRGVNGTVVGWRSETQDNSSASIYGQLLDNDGGKVGGEFPLSSLQNDEQGVPSLAATPQGFVTAWSGTEASISGFEIYVRNFMGSGNSVGAEPQVNTYTLSSQDGASVASCSNISLVTWDSWQDGSLYGVYGRYVDLQGSFITAPFQINSNTFASQWRSNAACHDQNFLVTYESEIDLTGNGTVIKAQGIDINGTLIGPEMNVSDEVTNNFYPKIGACGDIFGITWEITASTGKRQILAKFFNKQFQNITSVFSPETGTVDLYDLRFTSHPNGCLFLWSVASSAPPGLRGMILTYTPPVMSPTTAPTPTPASNPTPAPASNPTPTPSPETTFSSTRTMTTTTSGITLTKSPTTQDTSASTTSTGTLMQQLPPPANDSQLSLILGLGFGGLALYCSSGIMALLAIAKNLKVRNSSTPEPKERKRQSSSPALDLGGGNHYGRLAIYDENEQHEVNSVVLPSPKGHSDSKHRRRSVHSRRQSQTMELANTMSVSDPSNGYTAIQLKSQSSPPNQISSNYIEATALSHYHEAPPGGKIPKAMYESSGTETIEFTKDPTS